MTDEDQSQPGRRLRILEARLVAATRAPEVAAIAKAAASSKAAIPQIMRAFTLTEEQAVAVLDAQFREVTAAAREKLEEEIRALKAAGLA